MRISDWSSDVCSSDLGGTFNSGPTGIQANPRQSQTAVDIELGMSGRLGAADFELSAYQSRFKGEVLIQVDQNFARVDARNAERTVVDGIEAATSFRSEEHTSGLQSLMRISYAVFCLKKKKTTQDTEIKT